MGIETGEQGGATRATSGIVIELRESDAVRRQAVQVRCLNFAPVAAEVGKTHVIGQNEQNVWRLAGAARSDIAVRIAPLSKTILRIMELPKVQHDADCAGRNASANRLGRKKFAWFLQKGFSAEGRDDYSPTFQGWECDLKVA